MKLNGVLIIESQYFANITYYKNVIGSEYVIIEQYDEHRKKSFSNRTVIAGANGRINLSIPLEKGRSQKTLSKDVKICNAENWQVRHWRSILSSYNNSPWFSHYSDSLSALFLKRFVFLQDWNMACLDWTIGILKLDIRYQLSGQWIEQMPSGTRDLRHTILPGGDGPAKIVRYPQVFENRFGFIADLSILDLLFCEGPKRSLALLQDQV